MNTQCNGLYVLNALQIGEAPQGAQLHIPLFPQIPACTFG